MKRMLSVAVAVVAAVLLMGSVEGVVRAQSSGLGITPRRDLTVSPGKTITDTLTVNNLSRDQDLTLTLQVIDFGAKDETGTPSLRLDPNAAQTPWSLKPFLDAPRSLKLAPGKSENIKYTISMPKEQGAGSYYSAIRYVAEGSEGGNVSVTASGATLVFVTVPGAAKESLLLQKFGAYEKPVGNTNGTYKSLFVAKQPERLAFTLKNQGNVAERPAGSILIKNTFGKQIRVIKDVNPKTSLALIDQTRRFEVCVAPREDKGNDEAEKSKLAAEGKECLDPGLAPGRYTATLSAFYGINGNSTQEILATTSFWYLPVWFLAVVAVVIAAVALGAYLVYRRFTGRGNFSRRR